MIKIITMDDIATEVTLFTQYLVGSDPSEQVQNLYRKAVEGYTGVLSHQDQRRLQFLRRHPGFIGWVDAGLAILEPNSEVRRRLYALFSILEATPEHASHFLPKKKSKWYLGVVVMVGIRAVAKAVIGGLLIKTIMR